VADELENNSDPNEEDTDGDTWNDGDELDRGTDPLDPNDFPRAPSQTVSGYLLIPLILGILILTGISIKKIKIKNL